VFRLHLDLQKSNSFHEVNAPNHHLPGKDIVVPETAYAKIYMEPRWYS